MDDGFASFINKDYSFHKKEIKIREIKEVVNDFLNNSWSDIDLKIILTIILNLNLESLFKQNDKEVIDIKIEQEDIIKFNLVYFLIWLYQSWCDIYLKNTFVDNNKVSDKIEIRKWECLFFTIPLKWNRNYTKYNFLKVHVKLNTWNWLYNFDPNKCDYFINELLADKNCYEWGICKKEIYIERYDNDIEYLCEWYSNYLQFIVQFFSQFYKSEDNWKVNIQIKFKNKKPVFTIYREVFNLVIEEWKEYEVLNNFIYSKKTSVSVEEFKWVLDIKNERLKYILNKKLLDIRKNFINKDYINFIRDCWFFFEWFMIDRLSEYTWINYFDSSNKKIEFYNKERQKNEIQNLTTNNIIIFFNKTWIFTKEELDYANTINKARNSVSHSKQFIIDWLISEDESKNVIDCLKKLYNKRFMYN